MNQMINNKGLITTNVYPKGFICTNFYKPFAKAHF